MARLQVGDKLPAELATCVRQDGTEVSLATAGHCVIFIYPEANTPGCTRQACGFRDNYKVFTDAGMAVFGASLCDPAKQSKFITEHSLPYTLLSLTSAQLAALGATKPSGSPLRSHLIVGADGVVAEAAYAVSPEASFERAAAYAKGLQSKPTPAPSAPPTAATPPTTAAGKAPAAGKARAAPAPAAAAAAAAEGSESEDDGGGLASLLGGDLEDSEDEEDFVPGEEEEDVEIEDDSGDEAGAGAAATAAPTPAPDAGAAATASAAPPAAQPEESEEEDEDDGGGLAGLMGSDIEDDAEEADFVPGAEQEDLDIEDDSADEGGHVSKKPRVDEGPASVQ